MSLPTGTWKTKLTKPLHWALSGRKNTADGSINKRVKWKRREQSAFILKLGELLYAGYHLSDALVFLQSQESKPRKQAITEGLNMLKGGQTLYEVLAYLGFHAQLLQFVYYAEYYGDVPKALMDGGAFWEKRGKDREQFFKIMIYPFMLILMTVVIGIMLQGMLLPKFEELYSSMNLEPTFFMKNILFLSAVSTYIPYVCLMLAAACILLRQTWYKTLTAEKKKQFLLRFPVLGSYLRMYDTYFISYQLSALLTGGLSINDSIQLFSQHNQQAFFQAVCKRIHRDLSSGDSLPVVFGRLPYFEQHLSEVMENGQKNGKLDMELYQYSKMVIARLEMKIGALIKLIQPTLFISVGLVVVSIYLSVLLPMFSMMDYM
ncbi:competence type IV pilus assembly protein ComGB [Bacillus sp. 1P06AnD]|uniref:competence type IV pilus assembly protein ComGB n=1 Tax=Bacillus sp. 1P06AnD TaxID=3132208 RepID=UPI0039A24A88